MCLYNIQPADQSNDLLQHYHHYHLKIIMLDFLVGMHYTTQIRAAAAAIYNAHSFDSAAAKGKLGHWVHNDPTDDNGLATMIEQLWRLKSTYMYVRGRSKTTRNGFFYGVTNTSTNSEILYSNRRDMQPILCLK